MKLGSPSLLGDTYPNINETNTPSEASYHTSVEHGDSEGKRRGAKEGDTYIHTPRKESFTPCIHTAGPWWVTS